jgi:hydroxymethylbilane synthase
MPQSRSPFRIGTRGSKLALAQAGLVKDALAVRGCACELVILKTTGDRITDRPLADAGGKGLFTKELDEALLSHAIDLAVHSMKDVPVALPQGLEIVALLPREDPRDAFLSPKAKSLAELPRGSRVGTSSVRRQALVARARPDLEIALLRGNVDTRLAKLDAGNFDAILLALAGLKRLGLESRATAILPAQDWLPALSQGAIGIEIRGADAGAREAVSGLNDRATAIALACERAFQAVLDGSCRTPIGGLAEYEAETLRFRGEVTAPDGSGFADTEFTCALVDDAEAEAARLGREAGLALKPRAQQWLAL